MKKRFVSLWLVMLMLPACVIPAYANEGYALVSRNFMPQNIITILSSDTSVWLIDHDPTQGQVEYVSWISYETLSEMSMKWRTAGVIVFNTTMNAYFLRVSYTPSISTDGQLVYNALGTSNGFCYGSKATEKGDTNVDVDININQTTLTKRYVSDTLIYSVKKTAEDVTKGLVNIMEWLDVVVDAILLVVKQVDLTNDLLYWIATNFDDMLYAIGRANLLVAEVAINQWEELIRLEDFLSAINYNQVYAHYAESQFFVDMTTAVAGLGSRLDTLITNTAGIGSRLDGIINNGAVQVNTASVDARLDKLISMYSKVNSVVLDTAAVNGGQITGAVGGALQDVMIYGRTRRENSQLTTTLPGLSVNGTPFVLGNTPLRSVHFTASVPAYITNDADLAAGVWKAGTYNYVSDTYNASTGEYVQRINAITLTGEETWSMAARAGSSSIFYTSFTGSNLRAECNLFNYVVPSTDFTQASANVDALGAAFTIYSNALRFVSPVTSVDAWKTYLKNRVAEGNPVTVFWVPDPATEGTGTVSSWYADTAPSITIPEGDSTITADGLRVTGKYETYDSYTKTADIIAAINNIPPYDDSGLIAAITGMATPTVTTDLTEVTSRLDLILAELQSTSGSATCEHTYAQHMEQDADCTLPGLMISTCSKCGDSYSEIVDPLGHDWVVSSHVDAVTDPDTGDETASAYDVYTCSRCDRTYEDHTGDGAPNEDYSNTSISKLVVQVFSKLGTFAGKLIGFFVHLLDKALTSVDNVISKFNDYTAQITGFGGSYTTWLTGFWGIIPSELQIALTFSVICMALGAVGKRLLFS